VKNPVTSFSEPIFDLRNNTLTCYIFIFMTQSCVALILVITISLQAAPAAKKTAKVFKSGEPAFEVDHTQPAFDASQVKPDSLDTSMFHVPAGLEISVWATSPMLFNPSNMDIDHRGRVWVCEGINYRRHSGRSREGDRIMVLEDADHDGKAEKSWCFVQEKSLECPLGIAVFDNVIVVSNTPDIIVYTDVDRDGKFDAKVDKREVLLTGFEQPQHDHSLHSVVGGPDGRWYFSNGNCGAQFTDRTGRQFSIGGAYLGNTYTGQKSADGHIYHGGFYASMDCSGGNVKIMGYGFRNSFEQSRNSYGDMFQNDNDDPPACRVSHIMEGGSFGFFSVDGKRSWQADKRPGQSIEVAEWRQEDPHTLPAGDIYGGGAPTGVAYYENGQLGEAWEGTLLSCDTGRNVVYGYKPKRKGAGFALERFEFVTTNKSGKFYGSDFVGGSNNMTDERSFLFRPSDVCVGPDGAVYISDWFDKRTGGHQDTDESCSGTIYRVAPKNFRTNVPTLRLDTVDGAIQALKSPAVNTRWLGVNLLQGQQHADKAERVAELLDSNNPFVAARAAWVLARLGATGQKKVREMLTLPEEDLRLVAYRALRSVNGTIIADATKMAEDVSPAIRAEAALSLRDVESEKAVPILTRVIKGWDGTDRSYLAAIGIGATGKQSALYAALGLNEPWSDSTARLMWKLLPQEAVPVLAKRVQSADLTPTQRKLALDTLAFIPTAAAMEAVVAAAKQADSPIKADILWWLIHRSSNDWADFGLIAKLKTEGILDPDKIVLTPVVTPPAPDLAQGPKVEEVLALKGDPIKGAATAQRCYMCHQIENVGIEFGPNLTSFGKMQPSDVIAQAIINPSKDIAHGYDAQSITTKDGVQIDGIVISDSTFVIVLSQGGMSQIIPREKIQKKSKLGRSIMLSASQLGMTAQDVADTIAYLKSLK
jgi:putative membrane-bound dehydrogenase-like protein